MMKGEIPKVRAYQAANSVEAGIVQGLMHEEGIDAELGPHQAAGAVGELPIEAARVEILVPESQLEYAREVVQTYEARRSGAAPAVEESLIEQAVAESASNPAATEQAEAQVRGDKRGKSPARFFIFLAILLAMIWLARFALVS